MPFRIVRNDITKMLVDAIVNTANEEPIYSSGTDTAVYEAAGEKELLIERQKIGCLKEGEVAITPGFKLPAKYIIHAVSPFYEDGTKGEEEKLRSCYEKSLQLALDHGCKSIAFPLIATGSYGYPKAKGMEIALSVIHNFLMKEEMMIYLVVFDQEAVRLSGQIFEDIEAFIDENYVEEKQKTEYGFGYEYQRRLMDLEEYSSDSFDVESDSVDESNSDDESDSDYESNFELFDEVRLDKDFLSKRTRGNGLNSEDKCNYDQEDTSQPTMSIPQSSISAPKRSLDDIVKHVGETFQQQLFRLIDERGRNEVEVYKGACKDKKFFSKIRSNVNYQPSKHTVFAFALSLQLSLDETKDLLASAGFALSPSSRFDLIMQYVFERRIYDMYQIDCILYDFGEDHYFSCE